MLFSNASLKLNAMIIYLLVPFEIQASCLSDMLAYGLIRSSTVTAASALMLEETVLWVEIVGYPRTVESKTSIDTTNLPFR